MSFYLGNSLTYIFSVTTALDLDREEKIRTGKTPGALQFAKNKTKKFKYEMDNESPFTYGDGVVIRKVWTFYEDLWWNNWLFMQWRGTVSMQVQSDK